MTSVGRQLVSCVEKSSRVHFRVFRSVFLDFSFLDSQLSLLGQVVDVVVVVVVVAVVADVVAAAAAICRLSSIYPRRFGN